MKVQLIFVGKTTEKYLSEGVEDFVGRLSRFGTIKCEIVKASTISDIPKAMAEEEKNILSKLRPADFIVVLDENGVEAGSRQLAGKMQKWMELGKSRIVFVVGGAYGISPSLKKRSDYLLSLSKLTFTHQMVRLILAEQLYRAMTIIKNEKYHHD